MSDSQPSAHDLMLQASDTAEMYLAKAVSAVDAQFGDGFAAANPVLVAAFMNACTADFAACMVSNAIRAVGDGVYAGLNNMA